MKLVMKDCKVSLFPCSLVTKLDEERLLSSDKVVDEQLTQLLEEPTVIGGILLNHTRAGPLRVVGKALHIISSEIP